MKHNESEGSTEVHLPETEIEWRLSDIPDITEVSLEDTSNLFGRTFAQKIVVEDQESILPPTLIQIEEIRQEAETEGFAQGKEEGYQAGLDAGRLEGLKLGHDEGFEQGAEQGYQESAEKALELVKRFEGLLEQFEKPLELLDNEIEQELVSLTLKLSRAVINHEINTHPEHVLAALRQGVDFLSLRGQDVVIRLHPDDNLLIQELYTVNQLEKNRWDLEIDPSLARGDCIIASQRSCVDMRLESRISAVLEELESHHESLGQVIKEQKTSLNTSSMTNKLDPVESAINSDPEEATDAIESIRHQVPGDEPETQIDDMDNQVLADESDTQIDDMDNQVPGDESDTQIDDVDNQVPGDEPETQIDDMGNPVSGDEPETQIDDMDNQVSDDESDNEIDDVDNQVSGDEPETQIDDVDNQVPADEPETQIDDMDNQVPADEPETQIDDADNKLSDDEPDNEINDVSDDILVDEEPE